MVAGVLCIGLSVALYVFGCEVADTRTAWMIATVLSGFVLGYRAWRHPWRVASVLMATQVVLVPLVALVTGGFDNPSGRSTGGVVAVGILMGIVLMSSSSPSAASCLGAKCRRRRPRPE